MRWLATAGFGLFGLMQLIFLLTGRDRPSPYLEVQFVSLAATTTMIVGLVRERPVVLAVGLWINDVTRAAQPLLGVTRLPAWLTVVFVAGWTYAAIAVTRGRDPRLGLWVLAVGHALAMLTAFGRFTAALALGLGAAGLFLAAPNLKIEK